MITGTVNADLEATVPLVILGTRSRQRQIEAVIDTGFTGYLTLPPSIIVALQLTWLGREQGILADGSVDFFDVYRAAVIWNGQPRAAREVLRVRTVSVLQVGGPIWANRTNRTTARDLLSSARDLYVKEKKMKKHEKHSVELEPHEYDMLIRNQMIASVCDDLLASPRKRNGYLVLRLTAEQLEYLTGFVAAEANHAKTREEEDVLGDVCEYLEGVLSGIRIKNNR